MKKKNLIVLVASLGLVLGACNNNQPTPPTPTPPEPVVVDPSLSVTSKTINVGESFVLTVNNVPEDVVPIWHQAGSATSFVLNSVVKADSATVTGIAAGTSTINVIVGDKTLSCVITVGTPAPIINHRDPFVTSVTDPSNTRNFREDFDSMIEDFSSANPSGETTGVYNNAALRVLVDSNDENEPTTPDAAIYKMATGNYEIHNFEGIGFRIRKAGDGYLPLSNLVLGLRGDDAFKVFPINLDKAVNPDGEALPELTNEFVDLIVSPGQSIEDANTYYELKDGGASTTKVLEKILGFHLYALDAECSAVVEIEKVFLVNAGETTVLDSFNRSDVGQADTTCWWRGSTGFIVQKGVTLLNKSYTTKEVTLGDYKNLVMTISGDTTGLKIGNVAYSSLKDNDNKALTGAVNGAFMSYVINLENSSLVPNGGKFTFTSTTEVVISQLFLTNLQNEAPAENYPYIDIPRASYATDFKFTVAKGTVKNNYDEAVLDTRVTDAGLNYMISYAGGENIAVDGNALQITGGNYEYCDLVIGSNADANKKYVVFAMKTDAKPSGFRFKLGNTANVVWLNDMLADAGLPSWSDAANYPYVTADGYKLVIVDLARNGLSGGNNELQLYYTGTANLEIGSIFFADTYKQEARVEETLMFEKTIAAKDPADYAYVEGYDLPADAKYVHIQTNATVDNQLRFEGPNGAKWLKDNAIIDIDGKVVADGSTDYVIDLEASGLKAAGVASALHTHSTATPTAFNIKASLYKLIPAVEQKVTEVRNVTVDAKDPADYSYVTGYDVASDIRYIKVDTTATVDNQLRFEGKATKWLKDNAVIGLDGQPVADGSTSFIIDLVASGLKDEGEARALHVHSTANATAFTVKLSTVELVPVTHQIDGAVVINKTIAAKEPADYAYVDGTDLAADVKYIKVETNAAVANQLRFEGKATKWLKDNAVIGLDGQPVADGSTSYVIDLEASGLKDAGVATAFHVHSTTGASDFTVKLTIVYRVVDGSYAHLLSTYVG